MTLIEFFAVVGIIATVWLMCEAIIWAVVKYFPDKPEVLDGEEPKYQFDERAWRTQDKRQGGTPDDKGEAL